MGRPVGPPVIDIHGHGESRAALELTKPEAERLGRVDHKPGNELTMAVNRRQRELTGLKFESVELRLQDMDAMGVDMQAVSVPPNQHYYWVKGDLVVRTFQTVNDELASMIAARPDRLVALGAVPLQDTLAAVAELRRCITELGFPGVEISTNVNGEEISAPRLELFWEKAEELQALVFIHPTGFTEPTRLLDHYFLNTIGHPLEETICAGRLIFDGVLERHPDLKIVFAHGGGYLPMYAGRFDHAYRVREDVGQGLSRAPSEYLSLLHFDTMVFEPAQLRYLVDRYGADHILLGTDYPFDMGEIDPVGLVERTDDLSESEVDRILGGNAAHLLGLESPAGG